VPAQRPDGSGEMQPIPRAPAQDVSDGFLHGRKRTSVGEVSAVGVVSTSLRDSLDVFESEDVRNRAGHGKV